MCTNRMCVLAVLSLFLVLSLLSCQSQPRVSFESLLLELADRDQLAQYPQPFYITRQFSSYDRASKSPEEGWFANWDRSMFIREEENRGRREYVMMDTEGPGAVVRFWMTFSGENSGEGTLRIYFNRSEEPSIEGTAFNILSRGQLTERPLSCPVSPETEFERRGHNLYMPLPYAEHIKITYETDNIVDWGAKSGGEAVYYNINYRAYEDGTIVETFTQELLEENAPILDEINQRLLERDYDSYINSLKADELFLKGAIESGGEKVQEISGSKAIREFQLQLEAEDINQALRSTILEIEFDGNRTVWCPVGDFFGTGYQMRYVNTWYTRVDEDGMMRSVWVMPFEKEAVIRIHNLDDQPVTIKQGKIMVSDWKWNRRSMHFGAAWQQYTDVYTGESKTMEGGGNPFDLNYCHLKGEGVVMGNVLTLFNTAYAWWGEGDEKIFIDGEDFPSHFGTGTEDFYGYAWCRPEIFNEPLIAQTDGSGNFWPGYTVNIRYRGLDAMPFTSEIRFDMEMWHWASTRMNYAPATFFYVKPGAEIQPEPDIDGAMEKVALKREDIISPWTKDGHIEGEHLMEIERSSGNISYPWDDEPGWSENQHLLWKEAKAGDTLLLGFKSAKSGPADASARLTTGPDYGVVDISINDSGPVRCNGYDSMQVGTKEVSLERCNLKEGINTIKVKIIFFAPENEKGIFGLDEITFNSSHS